MNTISMLVKIGITAVLFFFFSQILSAQEYTYRDMPAEVKNKMDTNKQKGLSYWDGISFQFYVTVSGLEKEEHQALKNRAYEIAEIKSISIDGNLVIVDAAGGVNFDKIKVIFSNLVSGITKIENKPYINQNGRK